MEVAHQTQEYLEDTEWERRARRALGSSEEEEEDDRLSYDDQDDSDGECLCWGWG